MELERFGWWPDWPDNRDTVYSAPVEDFATMPDLVDLRPGQVDPYSQGKSASCVSQSVAFLIESSQPTVECVPFTPSRLFVYYNARAREGTTGFDVGCTFRSAFKGLSAHGVCKEDLWAFDLDMIKKIPSPLAYHDAEPRRPFIRYSRLLQSADIIRHALADGRTIGFGAMIYKSFMSPNVVSTGQVPLPDASDGPIGGHALALVGYDHTKRIFIVRNSYGKKWGDGGYAYFPYDYILNPHLCQDFWVVYLNTLPVLPLPDDYMDLEIG